MRKEKQVASLSTQACIIHPLHPPHFGLHAGAQGKSIKLSLSRNGRPVIQTSSQNLRV